MEVISYLTTDRVNLLQKWLVALDDVKARVAIMRRIDRLKRGHLGDCRFCGEGVWELRIDFGPGYRIYYAMQSKSILLLLCGGSKRTQTTDIEKAIACWRDFQRRSHDW